MRISLASLKHAAFASRETPCFSAKVLLDDVPAFHVSNDGNGGCEDYEPLKGQTRADVEALLAKVAEYAATLPPVDFGFGPMPRTVESLIMGALDEALAVKDLKRMLAGKVLFLKDRQVYQMKLGAKPAQLQDSHWAKIAANNPGAVFLNRLPFDEALALYVAHASRG